MTINDAINEIHTEAVQAKRQALKFENKRYQNYYTKKAKNLEQLIAWLCDYKAITGKE